MNQSCEIRPALVIVLYNPTDDDLHHARMMADENEGMIVDNSTLPNFADERVGKMRYCCFEANLGIAEAQNRALRTLMTDVEAAYTHFVLLDQDSRPAKDFPRMMAEEYEAAASTAGVEQIAAIGPTIVNKSTGEAYTSAFHSAPTGTEHFARQREIIASGMCIARWALDEVGLNDASLFIDMVDHEWCWRAASKGYAVGTTPQVELAHAVGRPPIRIGRHTILTAAPVRYYFLCRNYLLLVRRPYVPTQWKVAMGLKRAAGFFIIPFTQRDGFSALRQMFRGVLHGLKRN